MFYLEGEKLKKLPMADQGFKWTHGVVRFQYCNVRVKNMKTMYQHAESERHREKLEMRRKDRKQILAQRSLGCLNINHKVTYVDDIEKDYQCSGFVASAKSNISINQLI